MPTKTEGTRDAKPEGEKSAQKSALADMLQRQFSERDRIRVTLDLTPSMKAVLDQLAEQMDGATQAEVLRRAIALLSTVKKAQEKGEEVALVKDDQLVAKLVGF